MYRGARPPGPRAAIEFDEVFAMIELDNEGKDDGTAEEPPPFEAPPTDDDAQQPEPDEP